MARCHREESRKLIRFLQRSNSFNLRGGGAWKEGGAEHESHLNPAHFDVNQKKLFDFLVTHCGLNHDVGDDDSSDNIDDRENDAFGCFDFESIVTFLKDVIQCNQDLQDIANHERAMQEDDADGRTSSLREVKAWIEDYASRAPTMPRNFYGQTSKEMQSFEPILTSEHCKMVQALCDREGLFCDIRNVSHAPETSSILIHSRARTTI